MKVQPLLSTKGDDLYDLSLCTDVMIIEIFEMKGDEIWELLEDIGDQLSLLEESEKWWLSRRAQEKAEK